MRDVMRGERRHLLRVVIATRERRQRERTRR